MLVCLSLKMLNILVLCPVLLVAGVQTLTIDSQLGTSIEDCFERVSIAEQLPPNAIYRNVTELTTRECEQICKQDKQCQSFDYGVGAKGNATCDLSKVDEKSLNEQKLLLRHPDYDVYVRRFQCEQSPPSPIQPQFDEPVEGPGPAHRPIFRPVEDQKSPFTDDYLISGDLESYGVQRPVYKPQYNERPDDYTNMKPDNDMGPSYGAHKPQDMPYKPEKPSHTGSHKPRPDPYDVLQFQDSRRPNDRPGYPVNDYDRPRPPYGSNKPDYPVNDYNRPKPTYVTEKPGYPVNDYNRPRPPHASEKPGYGLSDYDQPRPPHTSDKPGYGFSDYDRPRPPHGHEQPGYHLDEYNKPKPPHSLDKPGYPVNDNYGSRPHHESEKPGYSVNDYNRPKPPYVEEKPQYQYIIRRNRKPLPPNDYTMGQGYGQADPGYGSASAGYRPYPNKDPYDIARPGPQGPDGGYPQNSLYDDNSIHLEIVDPPRPYTPPKPTYHQGIYGYGTYSSQNPYSQPQGSNPPYYGSGPVAADSGYGTSPYRPDPIPESRPGYGEPSDTSYGNGAKPQKPAYGLDNPSSYGVQKPSYTNDRPYGNSPPYGVDRPSPVNDKPAYGVSKPPYNNDKPIQGSQKPPSEQSSQNDYSNLVAAIYGNQLSGQDTKPGTGDQKPPGTQGAYGNNQSAYGGGGSLDSSQEPHGPSQNSYVSYPGTFTGSRPSYGVSPGSYGNVQDLPAPQGPYSGNQGPYPPPGSYGSTGSFGDTQSPYGTTPRPPAPSSNDFNSGSYGGSSGPYGGNSGSYGGNPGSYSGTPGSYGSAQGSYGSSPGAAQVGYGTQTQSDGTRPTFSMRPGSDGSSGYGKPPKPKPSYDNGGAPGYGNPLDENRPDYPNPGYGADVNQGYGNNKPNIRPVYEYELDMPGNVPSYIARPGGEVVTTKPMVIGDFDAGYGRNQEKEIYKEETSHNQVSYDSNHGSTMKKIRESEYSRLVATIFGNEFSELESGMAKSYESQKLSDVKWFLTNK